MANELRHSDVGTALSKSEWEAVGGHIFNSQAAGDIMYASTTSQLSRLGIGSANQVLATNSGATAPEWVTSVASATLAATITVIDSTDTSSYIAMFDSATGSLAAKTDAGITYNAGTGMLTATGFTGPLTGTLVTAAQGNVTSLGTLTALTVDDVAIDGKVVTMTGSASDTAVFTAGTNGTLSIVTTEAAAAAANIQITADGTVDIDSAGVLTLDSGAAINIEPASGSAILLDGTISVDAGVVTGATSITSSAYVVGSDTLAEYIADTVGAMTTSNTETGITVTYQDADNTIDFAVGTLNQDTTGTATNATHVTVADNESTDENDLIPFIENASATGNVGLESDGDFHYNPSTGRLTATQLAGTLQTASQTAITAVGTIATGTWEATDVAVAHGGTGASTLAANGALIGNGTSAITSVDMGTKGDILIGDGSGNPSVLDLGTNDYILTADSGETTGVKWAALSSAAITATANGANNYVATYSASTALNGEANLQFDGSTLAVTGDITVSGGDITYGNGQNATLATAATAHDAAGRTLTITAGPTTAGTTNNIAGGALTIQGGQGKGTGVGGNIIFQTSNPATGAASSLNAYTTALTIESSVSSGSQIVIPDGGSIRFDEETGYNDEPGTDHTAHGIIFTFQASGAYDFGQVLRAGANGQVGLADADDAYAPAIGISVNAAQSVDGEPIDVLTHGIARDDTWNWTAGGTLYVSTTAGGLTQTKPSGDDDYVQIMGEALSDDTAFIMPSMTYITVDA